MAIIQNIINTLFTTSGADESLDATNRLSRGQTRLGQSSASAGRAFAAQSQGLGGLVGAYAGAAATTFALEAAFTALSTAARSSQTFEGLNALAGEIGASGEGLLASVAELSKNQLTLAEAASQASLSLSAGFNTDQIENLTTVALKASRALGRDLTDSMTRVVRGSAKMETELLDELGIYTKIEPATKAYAAVLGKSVTALTEFERRQAFANAVIDEGLRKYSSINTTIPTTAEAIEAFGTKILDLTLQLGMLLADGLAPLATFLTNNVAAALSVLGIAASMAASKGIQLLSAALTSMTANIVAGGMRAENFVRQLTGIQAAATAATAAISAVNAQTLRLTATENTRFSNIQAASSVRNLSRREIAESDKLIRKSIPALNAEKDAHIARRDALITTIRASQAVTDTRRAEYNSARATLASLQASNAGTAALTSAQTALASAQGRLGAATAAYNRVVAANGATLTATRAAVLGLNADLNRLNATLLSTAAAASGARVALAAFFAGVARFAANAASGVAMLFTGFVALASKVFFFVSIIALVGSAFANAIGKGAEFQALLSRIGSNIKGIFTDESAARTTSAIQGITAANLVELEKTNSELRGIDSFTFKTKSLGFNVEVTKTKEQLVSEVTNLLSQSANQIEKTVGDALTSSKAVTLGLAGLAVGSIFTPVAAALFGAIGYASGTIWDYFTEIPDLPKEISDKIRSKFEDALKGMDLGTQDIAVGALAALDKSYGAAARIDPGARAALKLQQQLLLQSVKYLDNIESVSNLMIATGQTSDKIIQNYNFEEAVNDVSYIDRVVTTLAGKKLTIEFIDIEDKALQNLINKDYTVNIIATELKGIEGLQEQITINTDFGSNIDIFSQNVTGAIDSIKYQAEQAGVSLEEFLRNGVPPEFNNINTILRATGTSLEDLALSFADLPLSTLQKPIEDVVGAFNSFSQAGARVLEVQRIIDDSLTNGTATLESFSQGVSNVGTSLIAAERSYYAFAAAIETLKAAEVALRKSDPEGADNLKEQVTLLEQAGARTLANLAVQRALTKEYDEQRTVLENQIKLSEFFKSFTKQAKNSLSLELEFASVGSDNVLATQAGYLSTFITDAKDAVSSYNKIVEGLKPLALSDDEQQNILSTIRKDGKALSDELTNVAEKIRASFNESTGALTITTNLGIEGRETTAIIPLLEQGVAGLASTSIDASNALSEVIRQAAEELPSMLNASTQELSKILEDTAITIKELGQQEILLKLEFDANIDQLSRDISMILQESAINQLELDLDLVSAKVDAGKLTKPEGASAENKIRQQLLVEQEYLILMQFGNELMVLQQRRDLLAVESANRIAALKEEGQAQIQKIDQDRENITSLAALYDVYKKSQEETNQSLVDGIINSGNAISLVWRNTFRDAAATINSALVAGLANSTAFTEQKTATPAKDIKLESGTDSIMSDTLKDYNNLVSNAIDSIQERVIKQVEAEETAYDRSIELLDLEQEKVVANYEARLAALKKQGDIEGYNALAREAEAAKGDGKLSEIQKKLQQLFDSIKGNIETAIMSLNNLIFYGEGNLGDIMGNLFKSIQQDFFKQTIADPLSTSITDSLFGLFGITNMKRGIENAKVENGALLVKVIEGPEQLISGLFSDGSSVTNANPSGNFLGNILGSLFGGLFMSQGGLVHLAQGGAASSSTMRRDRVPAMLEPGEFVLRKQSARKIGLPALQAMNANGNAGGAGNVSINVTNEGSPKQAEASQPRFDGEKYVVDVIMRDISNNGPIRRSLRSRGGI